METKILNQKDLQVAVDILRNGGLVAFATDTVFGLAALANHPIAVNKLLEIKQRPDDKPFPMMVSSLDHIESVANMTSRDRKIITRWMPGALTLILNKKETYLDDQQKQFSSIGIRMPKDSYILDLIQEVGPLLVPSANISNEPPATSFEEVYTVFDGKIDAIVVGITNPSGVPSTVLDATKETLNVLREGEITLNAIQHDLSEYLPMTIALATDHGGFELKEKLKVLLEKWDYEVMDFGSYDSESVDYPDTVYPAAKAVAAGDADFGIIFCGTGIGASISANKVKGIRCALVNDIALAKITREHNDSNILAMGGRVVDEETMIRIVSLWLTTPFSGGERHQRRIDKIKKIEDMEFDG